MNFLNNSKKSKDTDVLLFRPLSDEYGFPQVTLPMGLLSISSYLVEEGYSVKILDEIVDRNWRKIVIKHLRQKPVLVGISSITGKQIKYGLRFARFIKQNSDIPIVWGGKHPTILPIQTLENKLVDFVIKGEGEEALLALVDCLIKDRDFTQIEGLGFKKSGRCFLNEPKSLIDLSNFPTISYHLLKIEDYIHTIDEKRKLSIYSSRGCPHDCNFCSDKKFYKGKWRSFSIDKIFNEIKLFVNKYKVNFIYFRDENFFVDKKGVKDITKRLIKEKLGIKWSADCRIDYFVNYEQDFINLLKQSDCYLLSFGVESGSNRILNGINKDITKEQVLQVKNKLIRNKIYHSYSFMLGFPSETKEDLVQTVKLIYKLAKNNPYLETILISFCTPYPGTELFEKSIKRGFEPPKSLESWSNMNWDRLSLPWIDYKNRKELNRLFWDIWGIKKKKLRKYFLYKLKLYLNHDITFPNFEHCIWRYLRRLRLI